MSLKEPIKKISLVVLMTVLLIYFTTVTANYTARQEEKVLIKESENELEKTLAVYARVSSNSEQIKLLTEAIRAHEEREKVIARRHSASPGKNAHEVGYNYRDDQYQRHPVNQESADPNLPAGNDIHSKVPFGSDPSTWSPEPSHGDFLARKKTIELQQKYPSDPSSERLNRTKSNQLNRHSLPTHPAEARAFPLYPHTENAHLNNALDTMPEHKVAYINSIHNGTVDNLRVPTSAAGNIIRDLGPPSTTQRDTDFSNVLEENFVALSNKIRHHYHPKVLHIRPQEAQTWRYKQFPEATYLSGTTVQLPGGQYIKMNISGQNLSGVS